MFASLAVMAPIGSVAIVSAAEIADMAWDEANIAVLHSGDAEKFARSMLCADEASCQVDIQQFAWADFQSNGKYAFVDVWDEGGTVQTVGIYQRNSSGKINEQFIELQGYAHEDLTNAIRDLTGNGKKELLIDSGFGMGRDMAETPLAEFPLVYRLQDEQYVEASREFPSFYDKRGHVAADPKPEKRATDKLS